MNNLILKKLEQNYLFETNRVLVKSWQFLENSIFQKRNLIEDVLKIMTPNVTKSLPDGWQGLSTIEDAIKWIEERKKEGSFFAIQLRKTNEIVGFLFL